MNEQRIAEAEAKAAKLLHEAASEWEYPAYDEYDRTGAVREASVTKITTGIDAALTLALRLAESRGAWKQHLADGTHIHDSPNWTYTGCEAEAALQAIIEEIEK